MTRLAVLTLAAASILAACDPIDTSALTEIEQTVADARQTVEFANQRQAEIAQAVENPLGALQAVAGAQLARTPTDQPGVFVLTDVLTGCQFLATYAEGATGPSSITPRTEPGADGAPVQRCLGASERAALADSQPEG